MSERPVFVYAATYSSYDDCLADYEVLLDAHAEKLVGTYDVALIRKDDEGKIHVVKHEKPTQHGAWGGIAVGALVGVLFPPSLLGAAVRRPCRRDRRPPQRAACRARTRRSSARCSKVGRAR